MDYNMPLSKAKTHLKLSLRDKGYAITGVGRYEGKKFEQYADYQYLLKWDSLHPILKDYKKRIVEIPDYINKTEVISVSVKSISKFAVVLCSEKLFPKLTRETKAYAALAYLDDASIFKEDEIRKIEGYIRTYPDDMIVLFDDKISSKALTTFVSLTELNTKQKDVLLGIIQNVPELKAIVLNEESGGPNHELDLIPDKKPTAIEIKKNWTVQVKNMINGDTNEPFVNCAIRKYKGHDKKVVVPDVVGKNKVTEIQSNSYHGLFSDNPNIESVTIPGNIPSVSTYYMFNNCGNLREVIMGDNVTYLATDFMKFCNDVHLHVTDKLIGIKGCYGYEEAFAHSDNIIIHAPKGSYAIEYAKEHNMSFVEE